MNDLFISRKVFSTRPSCFASLRNKVCYQPAAGLQVVLHLLSERQDIARLRQAHTALDHHLFHLFQQPYRALDIPIKVALGTSPMSFSKVYFPAMLKVCPIADVS